MQESPLSRRSLSLGASSILAVAAIGLSAAPAFAGTPHHASSVHARQHTTHAMRGGPRMNFEFRAHRMRGIPRMN